MSPVEVRLHKNVSLGSFEFFSSTGLRVLQVQYSLVLTYQAGGIKMLLPLAVD